MTSKRRYLFTLFILLAFSYMVSSVSAIDESKEIDYIEDLGDGSRTIYYKDGHKDVFIDLSCEINFKSSVGATAWTVIIPGPEQIDWVPILNFIRDIMSLIAAAFAPKIPIATKKAEEILKKIRGNLRMQRDIR